MTSCRARRMSERRLESEYINSALNRVRRLESEYINSALNRVRRLAVP